MTNKILMWIIALGVIGGVFFGSAKLLSESNLASKEPTCLDLFVKYHGNWQKIQNVFNSDKEFYSYLDNDQDGSACDSYEKR